MAGRLNKQRTWLAGVVAAAYALPGLAAGADLSGGFGVGIGPGETAIAGDYTRQLAGQLFDIGWDVDTDRMRFILRGGTTTDNAFKHFDLVFGVGNRYAKVGLGWIWNASTIPTRSRTLGPWLLTDPGVDTQAAVSTVPVYVTLCPYRSDRSSILLGGYYGLYSAGDLQIPVKSAFGVRGYVQTEPKQGGGAYGARLATTWRLPTAHSWALRLEYRFERNILERGSAPILGDPFGLVPAVELPALTFEHRTLLLSLVLLTAN